MSTRAVIHFHNKRDDDPVASVYRHGDGYPESRHGVLADLDKFFGHVERHCAGSYSRRSTSFGR